MLTSLMKSSFLPISLRGVDLLAIEPSRAFALRRGMLMNLKTIVRLQNGLDSFGLGIGKLLVPGSRMNLYMAG